VLLPHLRKDIITLLIYCLFNNSRDSKVGIATGIRVGGPRNNGSIPGMGMKYSLVQKLQTADGAQTAFLLIGTGVQVTSFCK